MIEIIGMAHIGVRVADFARSISFYENLGFHLARHDMHEHVVVMKHNAGININLLDSVDADNGGRNVLMDEAVNYPGYTHIAIAIEDVTQAALYIRSLGVGITEGPVRFGDGSTSIFLRDPDRNVIELSQPETAVDKQEESQ